MKRLLIPMFVICVVLFAAPHTTETYDQPLTHDQFDAALWRFPVGQRPLAATLRVYGDGLRLTQSDDYRFGKDLDGLYIMMNTPRPSKVVVDFGE